MVYGTSRGGMVSWYLELTGEEKVTDARIGYRIEPDLHEGRGVCLDPWSEPGIDEAGEQAVGWGRPCRSSDRFRNWPEGRRVLNVADTGIPGQEESPASAMSRACRLPGGNHPSLPSASET